MNSELKGFTIVIPLHLPVDHPSDYIYQTARILRKQNQVILFDFQYPTIWRNLFREKNIFVFFQSLFSIVKNYKGLIYFRPISVFPLRRIDRIFRINQFLGMIQLKIILKLLRKKIIIWGFNPIMLFVVKKIGAEISFYDCIDCLGDDEKTREQKKLEQNLFSNVNLISFNSKALFEKKADENLNIKNKSRVVVCGCAYDMFNNSNEPIPNEIVHLKAKKILLAGVFDYRIDFALLNYLAKTNPLFNFILLGPILPEAKTNIQKLLKLKNVIYIGEKNKKSIPPYFQHCNLGIIPYKTSLKFVKYSHPMKAYEYLASGKPVVSTNILSLQNYPKNIVYTTDNYQDFNQAIRRLLKEWSQNDAKKAREIAKKNSWSNKVNQINDFFIKKYADKLNLRN